MKRSILFAFLLVVGAYSLGVAELPGLLDYQGILTDAVGTAVPDGSYDVTFRIYDVLSGGSPLWEEIQIGVPVTKGIFNVMLGSVVTLDLPFDVPYYLGISVEGEPELSPRIELSSAAYAFTAKGTYGDENVFPSDGNVGIGTAAAVPSAPLHVVSNEMTGIRIDGMLTASWANITLNAEGAASQPSYEYYRQGSYRGRTYLDNTNNWHLQLGGDKWISVLSTTGAVGIATDSPLEQLDVDGALRLGTTAADNAGTIRFTGSDFEGYDGSNWKSLTAGGSGSLPAGASGQTLRHDGANWVATGNLYNDGASIGIGTTSPGEDVHVMGTGTMQVRVETESSTGRSDLELKTTGGTNDYLMLTKYGPSAGGTTAGTIPLANLSHVFAGTQGGPMLLNVMTANPMYFATSNLERMRLDSSGNLGINTTAPDARLHVGGDVKIGTAAQTGSLEIYQAALATPMLTAGTTTHGADLVLFDELNNTTGSLMHDGNGEGGYFYVKRDPTYTAFRVDGNYSGTNDPMISMFGSSTSAAFNMGTVGNSSVQLPASSIGTSEIENETGVVSYAEGLSGLALDASIMMLAAQTISIPAPGYVLVIGTCQVEPNHTNTVTTSADFGVSASLAAFPANQDCLFRLDSDLPTGYYDFPITCHGLFSESSAGSYTYYLLGRENTGNVTVYDFQLTCVYIPTAYGTVEPTLAGGPGADVDDRVGPALSASDVAAGRAASEAANLARIEQELAELRAQFEALKISQEERE